MHRQTRILILLLTPSNCCSIAAPTLEQVTILHGEERTVLLAASYGDSKAASAMQGVNRTWAIVNLFFKS